MMYCSHEARESAIKDIRSIIKTLGEVKSEELDYLTYRGTIKYLNDLIEQIEKEDKPLSINFKRVPTITNSNGYREAISNCGFPLGTTVDDLYDAIEDSHSVESLVKNIAKLRLVRQFVLDRETSAYVRLKNVDRIGNISYMTISKLS